MTLAIRLRAQPDFLRRPEDFDRDAGHLLCRLDRAHGRRRTSCLRVERGHSGWSLRDCPASFGLLGSSFRASDCARHSALAAPTAISTTDNKASLTLFATMDRSTSRAMAVARGAAAFPAANSIAALAVTSQR